MPRRTADTLERPREATGRSVAKHLGQNAPPSNGVHAPTLGEAEDSARKAAPAIVPALENAIAIVNCLNARAPRPASLAEITAALSISKSHCHALLKTLTHFDWLAFDDETKVYRLQSGILSAASSLLNAPILGVIRPHLATLVARVHVPCLLSEPLGDGAFVLVDRFNTSHLLEVSFPIGHRFERDASVQMRAYLAWQTPEEIDKWMQQWTPVRYADRTPLSSADIRAEIGATRRRGFARSIGEFTEGLMAISLPIFDRAGRVVYVFSCCSLTGAFQPREAEIAREMQRVAAEIHRAILARTPPDFPG
jgi:DNA-binding IclR family transcriptional regulator